MALDSGPHNVGASRLQCMMPDPMRADEAVRAIGYGETWRVGMARHRVVVAVSPNDHII